MKTTIKKPKKGAGRKWASRLKELGEKEPPEALVKKINEADGEKQVARPASKTRDIEI